MTQNNGIMTFVMHSIPFNAGTLQHTFLVKRLFIILLLSVAGNNVYSSFFPTPAAVKFYNSHSVSKVYQPNRDYLKYSFLNPSIALNWKLKKHYFVEVELNSVSFQKYSRTVTTSGLGGVAQAEILTLKDRNFGTRIEFGKLVSSYQHSRWEFMYSGAVFLNRNRSENPDEVQKSYLVSNRQTYMAVQFVPRLNYQAGKRISFEANFPLNLFSMNSTFTEDATPGLESHKCAFRKTATEILPATFAVRLGMSIQLH